MRSNQRFLKTVSDIQMSKLAFRCTQYTVVYLSKIGIVFLGLSYLEARHDCVNAVKHNIPENIHLSKFSFGK